MVRTDGTPDVIPLLGDFQATRNRLRARLIGDSGGGSIVLWGATLAIAASSAAVALPLVGFALGPLVPTLALAGIALVAEKQSVRLSSNVEISVSFLPFILAAALLGPVSAMIVGAASLLALLEEPYIRWLVWTGTRALVCGASGLAVWAAGATHITSFPQALVVVVAASVTEVVWDVLLGALTVAIRGSGTLHGQLKTTIPVLLVAIPLYTPIVVVLAYSYKEVSPLTVAFFVIPAFAAQRLFLLYRHQRDAAQELAEFNLRLENVNLSFASALVATWMHAIGTRQAFNGSGSLCTRHCSKTLTFPKRSASGAPLRSCTRYWKGRVASRFVGKARAPYSRRAQADGEAHLNRARYPAERRRLRRDSVRRPLPPRTDRWPGISRRLARQRYSSAFANKRSCRRI